MIFNGDFGLFDRPDVQKTYTVQEIADMFNVTTDTVRNISNRMNLPHEYITKNRARLAVYPYEVVKIFREYFEAREKQRKLAEERKIKVVISEEATATELDHPLVKDKRFLKLSYFPDVIPDCFKECEE